MDGDEDPSLRLLLGQRAKQGRELGAVDLVHGLHWVVEEQPREATVHRQVQREEQGQRRRVQLSQTQPPSGPC
jgi:hypothetical protein